MLGSAMREVRSNSSLAHLGSMRLRVVGSVAVDRVRPPSRAAWLTCDRRDCVDQGNELGDVVTVRSRERDRERNAPSVRDEMVLASRTAPIDRAGPAFFPPRPWPARERSRRLLATN